MKTRTFVFDFYNLYIPKGKVYKNENEGIRIVPLKLAEEYEKNRSSLSSPFSTGGWKTAKCYITSSNEEEAKAKAMLLEHLYSFAQNRSVFFVKWYPYKRGIKYYTSESKFIEPRENRFSDLLYGTKGEGRDISLFINAAINTTLHELDEQNTYRIIKAIHSFNISKSDVVIELKFLLGWIVLENLANYDYAPKKLFNKNEVSEIKKKIILSVDKILENDSRRSILKKNLRKNFLYEHATSDKIIFYLEKLELEFDDSKLKKKIGDLLEIRAGLVHKLNSNYLIKKPENLFYLQKIVEKVLLRNLGIDKNVEKKLIVRQYNRGDEL